MSEFNHTSLIVVNFSYVSQIFCLNLIFNTLLLTDTKSTVSNLIFIQQQIFRFYLNNQHGPHHLN